MYTGKQRLHLTLGSRRMPNLWILNRNNGALIVYIVAIQMSPFGIQIQ